MVEQLSRSLLAKAFRGELVPTEAELAKVEGRDFGSAEQLLENIREELVSESPSKAQRNTMKKSGRALAAKI